MTCKLLLIWVCITTPPPVCDRGGCITYSQPEMCGVETIESGLSCSTCFERLSLPEYRDSWPKSFGCTPEIKQGRQ